MFDDCWNDIMEVSGDSSLEIAELQSVWEMRNFIKNDCTSIILKAVPGPSVQVPQLHNSFQCTMTKENI